MAYEDIVLVRPWRKLGRCGGRQMLLWKGRGAAGAGCAPGVPDQEGAESLLAAQSCAAASHEEQWGRTTFSWWSRREKEAG